MDLLRSYMHLINFIGGDFPDSDLEGLSDEEVATRFAQRVQPQALSIVIAEGKTLLGLDKFPSSEVGRLANRYFSDPEEGREWMAMIVRALEFEARLQAE